MKVRPTHLIADPWGPRQALCGVKKPLPHMWVEAAPAHTYPFAKCRECYTLAGLASMLEALEVQETLF